MLPCAMQMYIIALFLILVLQLNVIQVCYPEVFFRRGNICLPLWISLDLLNLLIVTESYSVAPLVSSSFSDHNLFSLSNCYGTCHCKFASMLDFNISVSFISLTEGFDGQTRKHNHINNAVW